MKSKKNNKQNWFISVRGSYLPANSKGWLTYLPFLGYLIVAELLAMRSNLSLLGKIYFVILQWFSAAVLMTWIARCKS